VSRAVELGLLRRAPAQPGAVREVIVPPSARRLSTLSRIDYGDAFLLRASSAHGRTGEQWARAILEDAPIATRSALLLGWSSLGLRLSPARSDRYVLGWRVMASAPDFALLAAGSHLGLRAQLLFKRQRRALLFCALLRQQNAVARAAWAAVEPVHRQVVPYVLEQAIRRERH
jgi:hypothetical protein